MSTKLELTLACGDYEILRALKEGSVQPDGIVGKTRKLAARGIRLAQLGGARVATTTVGQG